MFPRLRALGMLGLLALVAALLLRGALALIEPSARRDGTIVVGSKAFSESVVLAEAMAQLIEQRAGLRVERRHNLGGTHLCFQALRSGAIDLYPEYTGTILVAILQRPAMRDPVAVLRVAGQQCLTRWGLLVLEPLGFENTYALAVPEALAARLSLRRISDLAGHPELRAGFATEFLARQDGWPGLRRTYGLRFDGGVRGMEAGLMYRAAATGQVDVISAYSTDGRIVTMGLRVLEDDRRFFPPYEAVPFARRDALARNPRLARLLRALRGRISVEQMRAINAEVDSGRRSVRDAAHELIERWLH